MIFVAVGLWLVVRPAILQQPMGTNGFRVPGIALELVRSVDDVKKLLGDQNDPRREEERSRLTKDSFGFIPSYWLLLMAFSILLMKHKELWAYWLGLTAAVCASAAAIFDYQENWHIGQVLKTPLAQNTQFLVDNIRHASLSKWSLLFVTIALLSPMFLWRKDWRLLVGCFFVVSAVTGLVGARYYQPLFEWTIIPTSLAFIATGIMFVCFTDKFLHGLSPP